MILDGHIHIKPGEKKPEDLMHRLAEAGADGALILSLAPPDPWEKNDPIPASQRLEDLMTFTRAGTDLFPFFWIDPLQEDALEQVEDAVQHGVAGFKVICNTFHPRHPRALEIFRAIARQRKPILFHSGILWDGSPSSEFNRPAGFEALLEVEGLRFSLAHIGWPWCDELIAVYGKFLDAYKRRSGLSVEMFIDLTPGTPPIYRREALTKLLTVGYGVEDHIVFGSDCLANHYDVAWTRDWIARDKKIYEELGIHDDMIEKIFHANLLRFIGA